MRPSSRKRARRPTRARARSGIASAIFDLCLASMLSGVCSGRCFIRLRRRIGERQQLVDSIHRVPCDDLREHVSEIGVRIDAIHLAGLVVAGCAISLQPGDLTNSVGIDTGQWVIFFSLPPFLLRGIMICGSLRLACPLLPRRLATCASDDYHLNEFSKFNVGGGGTCTSLMTSSTKSRSGRGRRPPRFCRRRYPRAPVRGLSSWGRRSHRRQLARG
jgi:hypothetical protein